MSWLDNSLELIKSPLLCHICRVSHCILLSRIFQVGYILRYNDSHIHSIPVGITTLSNTMYKQINTQAGYNIADSQPIKTYSRMFQSSFKPRLEFDIYDVWSFSILYPFCIGLAVFIILHASSIVIAWNRRVWSCFKRSNLWCCFHLEMPFFGLSWNGQCFLIILWSSCKLGNT